MLRRQDIIQRFASKGYTKKDASFVLDDFIDVMTEILAEGRSVSLRGFGSFQVKEMKERESIDCRSGERILIPAIKAPRFVASARLRQIVRDGRIDD